MHYDLEQFSAYKHKRFDIHSVVMHKEDVAFYFIYVRKAVNLLSVLSQETTTLIIQSILHTFSVIDGM